MYTAKPVTEQNAVIIIIFIVLLDKREEKTKGFIVCL